MAIRDYWIYQKRNVFVPWALYIVKEYDRTKPEKTTIDFTFYHEEIPTQTHSKSFVGFHCATPREYADAITAEMAEFVSVNSQDYNQVLTELIRILA